MQLPTWIKPALYGVLAGALGLWLLGFYVFGWVSTTAANQLAIERSHAAVSTALTPYCLAAAQADPQYDARLATIKAESIVSRKAALVRDYGWANTPDSTSPDTRLAMNCVTALDS